MILIISQDFDPTTDSVIEWISYYNYPFFRLNPNDMVNLNIFIDIENKYFEIKTDQNIVCSKEISCVWYRRWHELEIIDENIISQSLLLELNRVSESEFFSVLRCMGLCLSDRFWLNKLEDTGLTKMKQLICANEVGLQIPKTFIINNKKDCIKIFQENHKLVTKATQSSLRFNDYNSYTNRITSEILDEMPNVFFPSTIQVEVEKDIELRIVYLYGEFYPMAIFSQQVEQTTIDFRKYSFDTPNRTVPYELPAEIKTKLAKLMELLSLNFGSIDMIKTKNEEYMFLEVNPVGQFGMVSNPCKYNIEQKIAQILIENGKKSNNRSF